MNQQRISLFELLFIINYAVYSFGACTLGMGSVRRDVLVIERMVSQLEACLNNNFSSFNSSAYKNYQKAADYSVAVVSSEYFVFSPENTAIQVNQLDRDYITQAHNPH